MIEDALARNRAAISSSLAARRTRAIAGVNTSAGVMDWLIPAPPSGYKIVLHRYTGDAVTGAGSTAVWTYKTGGSTVAACTTNCGRRVTASTVTAVYEVPVVSEVQPTAGAPLAIGEPGKAVVINGAITTGTAGNITADYSIVPDLAYQTDV